MDTAIVIAVIGGVFGTVGTIGNIVDHVMVGRVSSKVGDGRLDLDRDAATSADQKWMIGELKDERAALKTQVEALTDRIKVLTDEHVANMAEVRTDHETLKRLYHEALERVESLEMTISQLEDQAHGR